MECLSCGLDVPEGARFCPGCGHPLRHAPDERRVVTVVFADLVGFTGWSEELDPERVKRLLDHAFTGLANDVTAFGGRVDKVVGDALVALFGAPVAHEDDAERGVRAALQMQATVAGLAASEELDLALRIGVNTGEVLVGGMSTGDDYTAHGDVVNVAQRLQGAAEPGQVLVGTATEAATRHAVRYTRVGELAVRNRDAPVTAHLAHEIVSLPGQRRESKSSLIGREPELALVDGILRSACARRRAHLALLLGEAGVGKRRLADEVAERASRDHGALVLRGRCLPYGEASVLWPVAEMIRQACEQRPAVVEAARSADPTRALVDRALGLQDRDAAVPEVPHIAEGLMRLVRGELDDAAAPETADADAVVEAGVTMLVDFLRHFAAERPVLLVVTDLHWADELFLRLTARVLDGLEREPVVAVGTARHAQAEDPTATGRINRTVLQLEPLDAADATRLLETLLPASPGPEVERLLVERSGGNPLFLEEFAALLDESGMLASAADAADGPAPDLSVPSSLRGLVAARLDGLESDERAVLADAAVVGRSGPVAALDALADVRSAAPVGPVLARLVDRDLLVVDDGEYDFRSAVVREVAYETLPKSERVRRHALLATWLAEHLDADEHLERIAVHYGEAAELLQELGRVEGVADDVPRCAVETLERAAARAAKRGLWVVAAGLLGRALRLDALTGLQRARLRLDRAAARAALRDLDRARADVDLVLEATGEPDTVELRARALTVLGDLLQKQGEARRATRALAEAIELWRELGDEAGRGQALQTLAATHLFSGELDQAREVVAETLEVSHSSGDDHTGAWALQQLALIAFLQGRLEESEEQLAVAEERFAGSGDRSGLGFVHGLRGFVHLYRGELDEAERLADSLLPEAETLGDRWAQAMMRVLQAAVDLWRGRTARAVERAARAHQQLVELDDQWGGTQAGLTAARALVVSGRVREGLRLLDETRSVARRQHNPGIQAIVAHFSAGIAVHLGEGARIAKDVRTVERLAVDRGRAAADELAVLDTLGRLLRGTSDAAVARLGEVLDRAGDEPPGAFAAGALALAAAVEGDARRVEAAAGHLEHASGATYLDRAFVELARAGIELRAGDRDGAVGRLARLRGELDTTGDRVTVAVIDLAGARAADVDEREALDTLRALGVRTRGWRGLVGRLFPGPDDRGPPAG